MKTNSRQIRIHAAMLALLLLTQAACAFYSPSTGRWLNRDPINEPGHGALVSGVVSVLNLQEEHNRYSFVRDNPISLYDPDGRLVGYLIAAIAAGKGVKPEGCPPQGFGAGIWRLTAQGTMRC